MLLGGDEIRRTQGGNNNAYCQDNETSWLDWSRLAQHQDIYRFTRGMIAFRCAHPVLSKEQFYTDEEIGGSTRLAKCRTGLTRRQRSFGCLIQESERARCC